MGERPPRLYGTQQVSYAKRNGCELSGWGLLPHERLREHHSPTSLAFAAESPVRSSEWLGGAMSPIRDASPSCSMSRRCGKSLIRLAVPTA